MERLCLGYCRLRLLTTVNNNTIVAYVANIVVCTYATAVYLHSIEDTTIKKGIVRLISALYFC